MDRVTLEILSTELRQDAAVMAEAARLAGERLRAGFPGSLEASGYELHRLYNVVEKAFERVCVTFENHFDKSGDYHERLIERISLAIPEVRPAFLPIEERMSVRELKGFRHLFRHTYDLQLRKDRLTELVDVAHRVANSFPTWAAAFLGTIRKSLDEQVKADAEDGR